MVCIGAYLTVDSAEEDWVKSNSPLYKIVGWLIYFLVVIGL